MIDYSKIDYDNPEEVDEAIETLEKLHADRRLMEIYEYRESALHDYVDGMNSAEKRGEERGIAKGRAEEREKMISQMRLQGISEDKIQAMLDEIKDKNH